MARLLLVAAAGLALLSALADAQGFVHAARIWDGEHVVWSKVGKASAAYVVGFSIYFLAVILLEKLGIHAPEIPDDDLVRFFTIIGVGVLSGQFLKWQPVD